MWIIWCHLCIVSSLTRTLLAKAIYPTTMTVSMLAMSVGSFVVLTRVEKAVIPVSLSDMMSNVKLSDITYAHHQFMLIYTTECGIGHTSYKYIFSNLRSTTARSNMTQESVNSDERCDGWPLLPPYNADQQQHLLLLSNGSHNQPMPFGKSKEGKGLELHICTTWVCLWKLDYIEDKKIHLQSARETSAERVVHNSIIPNQLMHMGQDLDTLHPPSRLYRRSVYFVETNHTKHSKIVFAPPMRPNF